MDVQPIREAVASSRRRLCRLIVMKITLEKLEWAMGELYIICDICHSLCYSLASSLHGGTNH